MPDRPSAPQISALFRKTPVMLMSDLERAVRGRSRRSLFRDLTSLGYLSSYTHTGRYYTLGSVPDFDGSRRPPEGNFHRKRDTTALCLDVES